MSARACSLIDASRTYIYAPYNDLKFSHVKCESLRGSSDDERLTRNGAKVLIAAHARSRSILLHSSGLEALYRSLEGKVGQYRCSIIRGNKVRYELKSLKNGFNKIIVQV